MTGTRLTPARKSRCLSLPAAAPGSYISIASPSPEALPYPILRRLSSTSTFCLAQPCAFVQPFLHALHHDIEDRDERYR